ncbi:MAG: hypothetical protein LBC86_04355 [Oscillospiraceae bacterium]|jgi:hypothetical protein|nr:hypothetical protein [Oscillospiraceae bacterium]
MIAETQILTKTIEYLNEKCSPFSPVSIGGLSPNNSGISAEITPGYSKSVYLDGGVFQRLPVLILIRHGKHQTAMETAFKIAKTVCGITINGIKIDEKIAGINMGSAPEFMQRSGADYIYSLIINIDYLA